MDVVGRPPLSCASLAWRKISGHRVLTVVAKLSYRLVPGECELLEQALAVQSTDRYGVDAASRTLQEPSDLVPHKARAEVLVVGSAFAVGGAVASLKARVAYGPVDKTIEVFGDRVFVSDGTLREGPKLTSMSIGYERASAGPDNANPSGVRVNVIDALGRAPLPNLQPPGLYVTDKSTLIAPISFGPIAPWWPARRALWTVSGDPTLDRLANEPLVERVEKRFFNTTPLDQQLEVIGLNERLLLENLHPEHAVLVTTLPKARPHATVDGGQGEVPLVADTLFIDTDRQICSVTWRGSIDLADVDPAARILVRLERDGAVSKFPPEVGQQQFSIADEATSDSLAPVTSRDAGTRMPPRRASATLPFQRQQLSALPIRDPRVASLVAPPVYVAPSAPIPPVYNPGIVSQPERPVVVPSHAVVVGAEAASNAAAQAAASHSEPSQRDASSATRGSRVSASEPIDLVWFDPRSIKRFRLYFKALLAEIEFDDFDSKHEVPSDDPDIDKARNEMLGVLTRELASDPSVARRILTEAIDDNGRFTPPLAVFEAELKMSYAEAARLDALVALTAPLVATDKRLKDLSEQAVDIKARPMAAAGGALARISTQIREHYASTHARGGQGVNLDAEVDRILLDTRSFDPKTLLGSKHLRATLGHGGTAVVSYVPEQAADHLPLLDGFRARIIAEVHPRQDRLEPSGLALRVIAIARVLARDDL